MARISFDQLTTFLTVIRMRGVSKAAVALNLTQPAVSARIKNLEATLGCTLFERDAGGARLTKQGERLQAYAEQFERLSEMVAREVIAPEHIEGHLRLGVSETVAQCWLPQLVARLHRHFPKLELELNVDISINLREGLLNREIDLAILLGPVSEYTVENVDLPGFDLGWYIAAGAGEAADPKAYFQQPVLTYARNTRPYRELKDLLFSHVGPGVSLFPSASLSACFRLVEAQLGVAALPRALATDSLKAGKIREFDPGWTPPPLQFSACYLGEPKSHICETAAKMSREVALDYARAIK